jgi:hypothetical protein
MVSFRPSFHALMNSSGSSSLLALSLESAASSARPNVCGGLFTLITLSSPLRGVIPAYKDTGNDRNGRMCDNILSRASVSSYTSSCR